MVWASRGGNPHFNQEQAGEELSIDQRTVSDKTKVARALLAGDQEVINASSLSAAINILGRRNRRLSEETHEQMQRLVNPEVPVAPDSILNLDFNEWAPTYDGPKLPKFNFVHCDFPYGIGADKFNQGAAPTLGGFEDDPKVYWRLCKSLCDNLDRLCTADCQFMLWFSMKYYAETLEFFAGRGIEFDRFPLVWMKDDNTGIAPNTDKGQRRIYETAFFGSRGGRRPIAHPVANAFAWPAEKSTRPHMSYKPVEVLQHFFKMFVDGSTLMLDPTAGSGSSLVAAESRGAYYVLGLEENEDFCGDANRAVRKAQAKKAAADAALKAAEG
jgi:hypothetical protein